MKKFKMVLGLIIAAFIGLFLYQNQTFFMEKHILSLKLPFMEQYHLPELWNAVLFVAFLLIGLLIAYFFSLLERFRLNKSIKGLNATVDANLEMISSLKNELAKFQTPQPDNPNQNAGADQPEAVEQGAEEKQ